MNSNFKIVLGIYLKHGDFELDLHNTYDFEEVVYSIVDRRVTLRWRRSRREGMDQTLPAALRVDFEEVSEFRFFPRDAEMPFTEDDCLSNFGFWTEEEWCGDGVMIMDAEPLTDGLMTALDFQSGAMIALRAERAMATILVDSHPLEGFRA